MYPFDGAQLYKCALFFLSLVIVAFGQPAWVPLLGVIASFSGYALFFRVLIALPSAKQRFWLATLWFSAVQGVQLSWFLSHPFLYIYAVYFFLIIFIGLQFGVLGILITPKRLKSWRALLGMAALYTIFEWSRLYLLSGFSFNPIGIALTSTVWGLQAASLVGIYGLTFWVIFLNLLTLRVWRQRPVILETAVQGSKVMQDLELESFSIGVEHSQTVKATPIETDYGSRDCVNLVPSTAVSRIIWVAACLAPYLFGYLHLQHHLPKIDRTHILRTVLVQTAFPTEETLTFSSWDAALAHVEKEWEEIFALLSKERGRKLDLVALPEYVVPYGTYLAVFPFEHVKELFTKAFGEEALNALPPLTPPLAMQESEMGFNLETAVQGTKVIQDLELESVSIGVEHSQKVKATPIEPNYGSRDCVNLVPSTDVSRFKVSNAFICQALANLFHADLVVGLQDEQWVKEGTRSYSAAFYFWPGADMGLRYEKRILVPMGEYIPFEFCRELAKAYGITGSFTCGEQAKVFPGSKAPFGLSVCYEETYGHLMRENRLKGAELLINLTSDVWYPNSRLPKQHFDHARLRTVEAGIPLVRACNTGITGAVDSLGQIVGSLGEDAEWERTAYYVEVPLYHYKTLYARFGDWLVMGFSLFCLLGLLPFKKS